MSCTEIQFIKQTEEEVICATRQNFGERDWRLRFIFDEFLKLPYFHGNLEPVNTDRGAFQTYCVGNYNQASYTLLNVYDLWRKGYYLESSILIRHLLEAFVQMRYFDKHPDLLQPHWTSQRRQDRVQFRTMFEELAPGCYPLIYGQFLSTIAHGNHNLSFRSEMFPSSSANASPSFTPIVGCKYDNTRANFFYSLLLSIVLGFLNFHPMFFPKNTVGSDVEFSNDLKYTLEWLKTNFDYGKSSARDPSLFEHMEKLTSV